ncbi:MAG: hypothetical protein Q4C91_22600 [Eubacteriales bacterium]|nr:hypothetical protein [Eubacteriales bacterium]
MDKLSVFSKKLGRTIDVGFGEKGILVTPEGVTLKDSGIVFAWNNSSGSWVDKGWNNSSGSWIDKGWNNSSGGWMDKGWNNSSGRWSDKGWSNSTGNWGDAGGGGGGCFITTACVEHKGLSDDCAELQILRKYRDTLVQEDEVFRGKVLEYYRKAPLIIQRIENDSECGMVYDDLYRDMIQPCVALLEAGKVDEAKSLYLDYYERLAEKYLAS